jgi:hypothetical protein
MQDNPISNPSGQSEPQPGDTQPVRVKKVADLPAQGESTSAAPNQRTPKPRRRLGMPAWFIGLLALVLLLITVTLAGIVGYIRGAQENQVAAQALSEQAIEEQFQLGLQDLTEGRYSVARQRFEFVLTQDPAYPGAVDGLAEAMSILYATSTPTAPPPTLVPTPTFDARPIQDLFAHTVTLIAGGNWSEAIETIASLRQADLMYQSPRVDGMLYAAFRHRGIAKILEQGNLQGGVFDLSMSERFGPLDAEADSVRTWARIYMIGTGFWEAYPEQAVYYFSQVAAAAPGLRDSSGWTAMERYRGALIQLGDKLANEGQWCEAQAQYELAMNIRADAALQQALTAAIEKCTPPTGTVTLTPTWTLPYTLTVTVTPTFTGIVLPSETPTPTFTIPVDTATPTPSETPIPPPPAPTETTPVP